MIASVAIASGDPTPRREPWIPSRVNSTARAMASGALIATALSNVGCAAKPNPANIELRKQVQTQQGEIDRLNAQHAADVASTAKSGAAQPSASPGGFDALFTTHGIRIGRLTGGSDTDPVIPGDDGLTVRVTPTDDGGEDLKAAGSITVEAFDLADKEIRIGRWNFTAEQARPLWNGQALRYEYVLPCPWQTKPNHPQLTVKVTFVDTLTGRSFTQQTAVTVRRE